MQDKRYIVGVSASLRQDSSVHTQTFFRAVNMAAALMPADTTLVWQDDSACFDGGREAAIRLRDAGVSVVVGHYASSAARGALPVYQEAGIPLLMPAATADALTIDFENSFRLCRNDSCLAEFMLQTLIKNTRYKKIFVAADDSVHGASLSKAIRTFFATKYQLVDAGMEPDAAIFAGSYRHSLAFLAHWRQTHDVPVYFTDDVVAPSLQRDAWLHRNGLYIFGHAPADRYPFAAALREAYRSLYEEDISTYFPETYAAMQIAMAAVPDPHFISDRPGYLARGRWQTVLGDLSFRDGESNRTSFALWRLSEEGGLITIDNLLAYAGQ